MATNPKLTDFETDCRYYVAGIKLTGAETKSVACGKYTISGSYASVSGQEVYIHGMHVSKFENDKSNTHIEDRVKKLLLKKHQILQLQTIFSVEHKFLIPAEVFQENGKFKVRIQICTKRNKQDKREAEKIKTCDKDIRLLK